MLVIRNQLRQRSAERATYACAQFAERVRCKDNMVRETQDQELKEQGSRSFLCAMQDAFRIFARRSSGVLGSAWTFVIAGLIIVIWGATGPAFHYSDTWQLIINTGTTIVTFLMVFLIQNTQNRDAKAVHLKLDEIIRAIEGARNELVDLEQLSDEDLKKLEQQFQSIRQKAEEDGNPLRQVASAQSH
jgi:low affinity Fe/Cu permease